MNSYQEFIDYYNRGRIHTGIGGKTPMSRVTNQPEQYSLVSRMCRGGFHGHYKAKGAAPHFSIIARRKVRDRVYV